LTAAIYVRPAVAARIQKLTEHSYDDHMDLNAVLPWDDGVRPDLLPKVPRSGWFYGQPAWERLDPEGRHELLRAEIARDVSMFIWFEQTLPPLYMGYINAYGEALPKSIVDYLLVFSKEEIVHTQMFRRYLDLAGLRMYGPPKGLHALFTEVLPSHSPLEGIVATMLIEWIAECTAMHAVDGAGDGDGVEPLTRSMFVSHHREELRHIAFGRWLVAELAADLDPDGLAKLRGFVEFLAEQAIKQSTINPEIADHVPFDLGIDDDDALEAARLSPHNRRINAERYGNVLEWLRSAGIVRPGFTIPYVEESLP
jgi:hypothetical protein